MTTVLEPTPAALDRAAAAVRDGGVVVAPSDTNLGLLLDPSHDAAVERAYAMKDRDPDKPLTMFVRDPDGWATYGAHPDPGVVDALADAFWPGPLNLVLAATEAVPHERCRRAGTVSISCLSNPVWRSLTDRLEGPLAMTSANRSGTLPDDQLVGVDLAVEHVGQAVDLVLDAEPEGTTRASTILDLSGDDPNTGTVLRQGDRQPAALERVADIDVR
jgi:L-threonylcarbamoyladenylate synthase